MDPTQLDAALNRVSGAIGLAKSLPLSIEGGRFDEDLKTLMSQLLDAQRLILALGATAFAAQRAEDASPPPD